jgi:hypothetical protein
MKTSDRALDEFHSLTRTLEWLSEREQIVRLKSELLDALDRAHGLERELEYLGDAADLGDALDRLQVPRSLLKLQERILAAAPSGAPREPCQRRALNQLRLELLETQWQCQALDALCRLLLRRMKAKGPSAASGCTHPQATP